MYGLLLAGLAACHASSDKKEQKIANPALALQPLGYDLARPAAAWPMPPALREISGLAYLRPGVLAAVQDEQGDVFLLNARTGSLKEHRIFGPPGDYEDLTLYEGRLLVLRSDGTLFDFRPEAAFLSGGATGQGRSLKSWKIGAAGENDFEGLCFDARTGWLMVAAKTTKGDEKDKTHRHIYFTDPATHRTWRGAVVREKDLETYGFTGKDATFKPSAIAVHPQTEHVFVLAAEGHKLLEMDRRGGRFISITRLDPEQFYKPEGLCFSPEGELFVASEGPKKGGKGMVYRFLPQNKAAATP